MTHRDEKSPPTPNVQVPSPEMRLKIERFSDKMTAQFIAGLSPEAIERLRAALPPQVDLLELHPDFDRLVAEAMQNAWDEICDDTGCHPLDIEQLGRRKLSFNARHWAAFTATRLRAVLSAPATSEGE